MPNQSGLTIRQRLESLGFGYIADIDEAFHRVLDCLEAANNDFNRRAYQETCQHLHGFYIASANLNEYRCRTCNKIR